MDGQALALLKIKSGKEREPDLTGRGRKLKVERLDRTWRTYVSRTCNGKRSSAETLPCSGHPEVEENAVVALARAIFRRYFSRAQQMWLTGYRHFDLEIVLHCRFLCSSRCSSCCSSRKLIPGRNCSFVCNFARRQRSLLVSRTS